ncbi:MAG TPA: YihY/virulence factor BrkB family protein [Polyangiaceae bacterium]|nr:YihY/virulence factor BrkB family protein [Polyangiaceae bacterium]
MTIPPSDRKAREPNLKRRAKIYYRQLRRKALSRPHARVVWLLGERLLGGEVSQTASAMTFDLFLAAIPMLALAGWLLGALLLREDSAAQLATSALLDITPSEVRTLVWSHLQQFKLVTVAPLVLLSALWMASAAFHTSMTLLEAAVGAPPRRWWHKRLLSLGWVICMIMVFGVGAWLSLQIAGGPERLLEKLAWSSPGDIARVTHTLVLALTLLVAMLLLGAFYRTAVYRGAPHRVWPGVIATTLVGAGVSLLFAYYVQSIARFAVFYGSLAAVAITLGWLYLLCFAFLGGAELNAVLDHEASLEDGHHPPLPRKSVQQSYADGALDGDLRRAEPSRDSAPLS